MPSYIFLNRVFSQYRLEVRPISGVFSFFCHLVKTDLSREMSVAWGPTTVILSDRVTV